jgi:hypothetical protein
MIRVITGEDEQARPLIILDGHFSGDSVSIVEAFFKEAERGPQPRTLYLRDVTAVDQSGKALLLRLRREGVKLRGSGVYTAYLVESLDREVEQNAP